MRRLAFTKLSGAGNDFILIDATKSPLPNGPTLARRLCARRVSVGADGLLVVARGKRNNPPSLRYYNSDGSAAFCGNGARAAAWWMRRAGWVANRFKFRANVGVLRAFISSGETGAVSMPDVKAPVRKKARALGKPYDTWFINTGVPHAVVRTTPLRLARMDIVAPGRPLRRHPAFGKPGANIDFIALEGKRVVLRTYERGVEDETLACGTGVVAAALCAHCWGAADSPVQVRAQGGDILAVRFKRDGNTYTDIELEGPVRRIFDGEIRL